MPNYSNQAQSSKDKKAYDLIGRTEKFGLDIIGFARTIKNDHISRPIISQLVRSATSIGANYMEADGAESGKDFKHKIGICKKEAKETMHWLKMLAAVEPEKDSGCKDRWKEAHELTLIFSAIILSCSKKV